MRRSVTICTFLILSGDKIKRMGGAYSSHMRKTYFYAQNVILENKETAICQLFYNLVHCT
jgi:hypothetical protein